MAPAKSAPNALNAPRPNAPQCPEAPNAPSAPRPRRGQDILGTVMDRGKLICGSRTDLLGFGYLDENGKNVGFDIDLCRAVAVALFNDPEAVEFVPLTAAERGPALQTGEIDMLSRNVTWTSSRDAQWGNFTIVMFYDGQGMMVRKADGYHHAGGPGRRHRLRDHRHHHRKEPGRQLPPARPGLRGGDL